MPPHVIFRTPDGLDHYLVHGDLIGRLGAAALRLDDPRVSEAHAMVSLRGGELKLLALRGRIATSGRPVPEVVLAAGQTLRLTRSLTLTVEQVELPDRVLAVTGEELPQTVLNGVCSLVLDPKPTIMAGLRTDAVAQLHNNDEDWSVSLPDREPFAVGPGDVFTAGGHRFALVEVALDTAGQRTRLDDTLQRPVTVVAHYDTVRMERPGMSPVTFGGKPARIVAELVSFGAPVDWAVLAGEIWGERPRHTLRRNLDVTLGRLRQKLVAAGIRQDLVRSDGSGNVVLALRPEDTAVDHS